MSRQKIDKKTEKIRLLQHLIEKGLRVFETEEVKKLAKEELGVDIPYVLQILSNLTKEGWVIPLKKGLYKLSRSTGVSPIHEFEIAMHLAKPAMISYFSAFYHHGLTDQVPRLVYLSAPKIHSTIYRRGSQNTQFKIEGIDYRIIQLKNEKFYGYEKAWRGEGAFVVADLERTVMEGFTNPQYCGGFNEVMYGLEEAMPKLNIEKLLGYALQWDVAVGRRIGWALEELNVGLTEEQCLKLLQPGHLGYRRLDPSQVSKGHYSKQWRLQINL